MVIYKGRSNLKITKVKYMAKLFLTSGLVLNVNPVKNKKSFSYEELRIFVEGMVEIVPLPSGKSIIVNEEGKCIGLPKNEKATEYWKEEYPIEKYPDNNDELIVGNALVATDEELGDL